MLNKNKVIIIIPTYNEGETITKTVNQLQSAISEIDSIEILVIDSNSTDNTVQQIKNLQDKFANIHLITEPQKSGLGAAYKKAMLYAMNSLNASVIFEFDADGSHQPKYIKPMLDQVFSGYDVVVGSRYIQGGSITSNWIWYRRWLSKCGNWFARGVLSHRYKDYTSGFRATKSEFLRKIQIEQLYWSDYTYKIELFWKLHKFGGKILEFPIDFIDRDAGVSKFPRNNILTSLWVVLRLRLEGFKRIRKTK